MYALMIYKIALLNKCLHTHITIMRSLTTTYITGIVAFSVVYMKLFIQCALVKRQRLNIRIYSDRETIIFTAMFTLNETPLLQNNCVIYKSAFSQKKILLNFFK